MSEQLDKLVVRARAACARTHEILQWVEEQGSPSESRVEARHICSEARTAVASSQRTRAKSHVLHDQRAAILQPVRDAFCLTDSSDDHRTIGIVVRLQLTAASSTS